MSPKSATHAWNILEGMESILIMSLTTPTGPDEVSTTCFIVYFVLVSSLDALQRSEVPEIITFDDLCNRDGVSSDG